jgi:peroxiredoxin
MFTRRSFFTMAGITLALAGASAMALDKDKSDDAKGKVKVGEKVPAFTATDAEGKERKLADFEGKILVLEWINPDCPVCERVYKDGLIKNTVDELNKIDENIEYVVVNSTTYQGPEVSKQWMEKHDLGEIVALIDQEGTLGKMFDARTTPHMYVIDSAGVLRYHGAFDSDPSGRAGKNDEDVTNYVINAVNQIKANETVAPDYIKPYGCSVKYKKGSSATKN